MYYPIRKELVGKRFMCVRDRPTQNSRPNSRSNRFSNPVDYSWKCGIIRACSKEESDNIEQKVLVEYDNQDWSSREWINIYNESWKIFLVEKTMVWAQREDPNNPKRPILWPGLTFYSLVDKHGLDESKLIGVEFLGDHVRAFCTSNEMRKYQEDDGLQPALRNNTKVVNELINWQTLQKSQGILIHGPFTLTGFRVQVYREKCRQWFSAVITSHDLITREMNVMDDTVLQTHRINPRLVMVLLLANEVELDSMLRGDLVRVLPPRRNRQSQVVITSPSPDTNRSGNSMWQFLTNMWSGTSSSHSGKDSNVGYSPSLTTNKALTSTAEISSSQLSATHKRRTSRSSQEDISLHPSLMSSPVKSSLGNPFPSGSHLPSPNSSPACHPSRYSSMEDLLLSSSSPQGTRKHISPQRPNSASIIHPSPQSPFSSPLKTSPHLRTPPRDQRTTPPRYHTTPPRDQRTTPPTANDSKHSHLGSPCHSSVSPFTPPRTSASLSPFRVSDRGAMFGSPVLGGHEGMGGSVMSDCAAPLHCRDPEAHLMGVCSCNSKQSASQAILTNQLHALQLQQHHQLQQQQNLSHCQMYISELQLLANRLKAVQQGSLTPEQREMLNLHYKQMLVQYQEASMSDYQSPAVAAQQLQMQMQLKYLEDQEKQLKYTTQPHLPLFDPEQFKSHLPIGGNPEHLHSMFSSFLLPKQNHESKEQTKNLDKNKQTVKEHVARLKRFMPNSQCQDKSPSHSTASSSSKFSSHGRVELEKKSTSCTASTQLATYKENNKTDDQKVVDALVNNKSSVSEKGISLNSPKDLSSNEQVSQTNITTDNNKFTVKKTREQSMNEIQDRSKANSDPFGFDQIADDVVPNSKSSPKLKSSLLHNLLQDDIARNVLQKTNTPTVTQQSPKEGTNLGEKCSSRIETIKTKGTASSSVSKPDSDEEKFSSHGITLRIHPSCENSSKGGNVKTSNKRIQSKKCTKNQTQVSSDESSDVVDTSNRGSEKANSRIISINATHGKTLKKVTDKVPKPQDGSLITESTDSNFTPNRASVIVYVDTNCSSKLDANLVTCASKDQSLTSSNVNPQFSVKTLESDKTSSHVTEKGLEKQELPTLGSNSEPKPAKKASKNARREGKGKKCKRQRKDKNIAESEEMPQSNLTKVEEQMSASQNLFSDSRLQDSSLDSETAISSSQDLVSRFLGHDGKSKIFPDLNILTSNLSSPDEQILSCRKFNSQKIEKKFPKLSKEEELRPLDEKKSHDQKMIREDKNLIQPSEKSPQKGCSNSSNIPVNFVSDQTVRSLTTVNRVQEPVALSSLIGTEYSVKQIKREDWEEVKKGLSEQRRQRKKSRKILENESLEEKTKEMSSSEPKKCKDVKTVHSDVVKNMDKKSNKGIKLEKVKGPKKAGKAKDEGNSRPQNSDSNVSVGSDETVIKENLPAWQKPQEEQNANGEKVQNDLEESNQNQSDDERKRDLPDEGTEFMKPPLQRSCSEDTIELNLECGERLSEVMNDIADLSTTNHSSTEIKNDDQLMKNDSVTEEKPLKELIDKLAAKKKTGTKKPRKRKKPEEKSEGQEIKKRKIMQPKDDFFIQNDSCAMFPKLPRCRDCRDKEDDTGSSPNQNCCRFALFRRLKKKRRSGKIHVAGFMLPENAEQDDLRPWIACDNVVDVLCKEEAQYILTNIADEFCSLVKEEKEVKKSRGDEAVISYKRAVGGLREMCDACATTIFNMHWVCHRCGFGVCLDCYNLRVKEKTNTPQSGRKMFQFKWFHCIPGLYHQPKNLIIAQIIPKQVLNELSDKLHQIRAKWNLGNDCPCQHDSEVLNAEESQEVSKPLEFLNDVCKPEAQPSPKVEGIPNPDNKGPEDKVCESKPSTKATLIEKARERLKEKSQNIKSVWTDGSSNLQEAKNTKGEEELTDQSAKVLGLSKASLANTASDAEMNDGELMETCPTVQSVDISQTINTTITQLAATPQKTHKKGSSNNKVQDFSNLSSGLSLLLNYDSSDDSAEDSPQKCHAESGSTSSAFDFNLGLLAFVASKRTETHGKQQLTDQGDTGEMAKESEAMNVFKEESCSKDVEEAQNIICSNIVTCTSGEPTCSAATTSSIESRDKGELSLTYKDYPAPHSFMCNQRLLRLHEPHHPGNQELFAKRWREGKPVLVSNIDKLLDRDLWSPESFEKEFGQEIADVVNCRTGKTLESFSVGDFWKGFESVKDRALDSNGEPMLLKLKDWPPGDDFCEKLPSRFKNLMDHIPLPAYTQRDGLRNLASRLPNFFVKPDLGPKMYNAYGSAAFPNEGTTNLHIDMSDAVNIMVYVGVPRDEGAGDKERAAAIKAVDIACDEIQQQRVRRETARIGALWHIFEVHDADKIREFLLEVGKERKMKYSSHHDPIHDQCFYLDEDLLGRLKKDHGVQGYAICQCLGDGVFIPAGAPHQVRNLYSCVKIAEDFVSPERIGQCLKTTQEFRHLSDKHTNHEDKLQIKNMIYHAVKDAVHVLQNHEKNSQSQDLSHDSF